MMSIKVPARICFFGDHQDYLGLPVIAGSINRFITLNAVPLNEKKFHLQLLDINRSRTISLDVLPDKVNNGDYLMAALVLLRQKGLSFDQGFHITISGNIPVNAGLSSSSALTVAWIRFLQAIQEKNSDVDDATIGHWAYQTEVDFFKSPGGLMDQYTIAQQGLLFIHSNSGKTERLSGGFESLVVAESGLAKHTLDVLKNARNYQEQAISEVCLKVPGFNIQRSMLSDYENYKNFVSKPLQKHWYAAIHNYDITKKAKILLNSDMPSPTALGGLMNDHQSILRDCIQNTPLPMTKMMNGALQAGALGAKTIGSGGGGCMVAITNANHKEHVINAFLKNGAKAAYEVQLTYPKK